MSDYLKKNLPNFPRDKYTGVEKFDYRCIDETDDAVYEADPMIREAMEKEASVLEMTNLLHRPSTLYSGTETQMEVAELEDNIRYLVQNCDYTYTALEDYLISLQYNLRDIRKAFKRVTGVDPQLYLSKLNIFEFAPSEIPPVCLGWGKAKTKYDYLFVMPFVTGYQIYGQKGDVREEVEFFIEYEDSLQYLKKNTKELNIRDPKVKEDLIDKDKIISPKQSPLQRKSMRYNMLSDYIEKNKSLIHKFEIKALLNNAFHEEEISEEEKNLLMKQAGLIFSYVDDLEEIVSEEDEEKKEKVRDIREEARDIQERSVSIMEEDQTPNEFFNELKDNTSNISQNIEKIMKYIGKKSDALSNFELEVITFKYQNVDKVQEDFDKNIEVEGDEDLKNFLAASAIIPLIVNVASLSGEYETLDIKGMIIFTIADGQIITDDLIKLENDRLYSLTNEGLHTAFTEYVM